MALPAPLALLALLVLLAARRTRGARSEAGSAVRGPDGLPGAEGGSGETPSGVDEDPQPQTGRRPSIGPLSSFFSFFFQTFLGDFNLRQLPLRRLEVL